MLLNFSLCDRVQIALWGYLPDCTLPSGLFLLSGLWPSLLCGDCF